MKNKITYLVFLGTFLIMFQNTLQAQLLLVDTQLTYQVNINGTSTLHNWECMVEEVYATPIYSYSENEINGIMELEVTIPVQSIVSGNRIMDRKMYEAFKYKDHPIIEFKLSRPFLLGDKSTMIASGILTIAGVSEEIEMLVNTSWLPGEVTFSGSKDLLMSDFGMIPPVALMGTVKTGNKITIEFQLSFLNNEEL